jgi:ketosteroid isomerase-like protein
MPSFSATGVLLLLFAVCSKTFAWQVSTKTNCQQLPSAANTRSFTALYASSDATDPVSRLPIMEAELAAEVDDDKRASLMERIADAKTSAEFGVRKAQFTFYDAFTNQDVTAMRNVWSDADDIRCVHPGMASLDGPDIVMKSWAQIFEGGEAFSIQPSRTRIDVSGQTALCSCFEETPGGGMLECLNVYRREEGNWKMILHMASPVMIRQEGT